MALLLLAVGGSYGTSQAQEDYRIFEAKTSQLDPAYAKGVSGHIAGEPRPGLLVMAGGCNFPDAQLEREERSAIILRSILPTILAQCMMLVSLRLRSWTWGGGS